MEKRWLYPPAMPARIERSLAEFTPLQRMILHRRGIETGLQASEYLQAARPLTSDPFLMRGMGSAVDRLERAIDSREKVVVYGDYDTDGVTASAVMLDFLENLGASVESYIPNRFDEGYGLNAGALARIQKSGVGLVLTVDLGIRSVEVIDSAAREGLDVIVTDHHRPGSELPPALAVINPKQPGDTYPFKDLSGVGLAYKLCQAIAARLSKPEPTSLLDLVAVGTVGDVVPLTGENRHLVAKGLEVLNRQERIGLRALARVARYAPGRLDATAIGFGLSPRLNAAGRMGSAEAALRLLVERDPNSAARLAEELDQANDERRRVTQDVVQRARSSIQERGVGEIIVVADPTFNEGVVGLAAARLAETYYRPALVARRGEATTRGSARSIPEFHITQALDQCAELIDRHGGHAAAAGFTVANDRWDELVGRLDHLAREAFAGREITPSLEIDANARLSEIDEPLLSFGARLEPCGHGNPAPVLAAHGVHILQRRVVGSDGGHLKLTLSDGVSFHDAIGFRLGGKHDQLPEIVDVAFKPEWNDYIGVRSIQLNVVDIRPASPSVPDRN
ncbi:MAG TPA: single-stranded-DNA-specific exonuclease RecJ [Anaerolineales bacterium]|nr:single-stranded-DNA-specific exonuclease RecJ [Anaerolineales bacterium]